MTWGKGIVLSFISFTVFVATLVAICLRQQVSLVSKDYYQKELQFQTQIDHMNNVGALESKPSFTFTKNNLTVHFTNLRKIERGEIQFFRPSDSELDRQFRILPTAGQAVSFNLSGMNAGMYKLRMNWWSEGKGFYIEHTVHL